MSFYFILEQEGFRLSSWSVVPEPFDKQISHISGTEIKQFTDRSWLDLLNVPFGFD